MAGMGQLFRSLDGPEPGEKYWERVTQAAGGTSGGVIKLLQGREQMYERLAALLRYAGTGRCRPAEIASYFGAPLLGPCGRCDNCARKPWLRAAAPPPAVGTLTTAQSARLDALSPLRVLARGYAVARDENGQVLKRVGQLPSGKAFRLRVTDGEVNGRVQ